MAGAVEVEDLFAAIGRELLPSVQKDVYETFAKVLGNIVKNPHEPKYRTLKRDNRLVAEKLCRSPATLSLLLAVGFKDEVATLRCPMEASLGQMEEVLELIQGILATWQEEEGGAASPAATGSSVEVPKCTAAGRKAELNPQNFSRRTDLEKQRSEQVDQLEAIRAAQKTQHHSGVGPAAAATAAAVAAEAASAAAQEKKKPVKTAFDFENRSKKEQQQQEASGSLEELRRQQREKFKEFQSDPNAKNAEAYHRPASVAGGGKVDQGWGDWVSGWFGGSGSSGGGGGGGGGRQPPAERRGPNIKTVGDLPKPVQRG